jgi:Ca-activated chloride channel homolog
MPAWDRCSLLVFLWFTFAAMAFAQTGIDDVHIVPRETIMPGSPPYLGNVARDPVIHTSVDLVTVPVTITDAMNRPVTGLEADNFEVFENKQLQQIKNFSTVDAPVSIGIIVDTSGSMESKLERVREAVLQFCDAANPQDEFFLITFSDSPQLTTDFTNRPEEIANALLTARPKGFTALLDAIYLGLREMKNARYPRRALLILSDGGDNHSRYTEREVKNAVKEADVLIYAVGAYDHYFLTREEMLGPELLTSVSEMTGGKAYVLDDIREVPAVTRSIGVQLRHQYMLAYRPEGKAQDGKWRKISVKLRLPSRLVLHIAARTGYYARAQ